MHRYGIFKDRSIFGELGLNLPPPGSGWAPGTPPPPSPAEAAQAAAEAPPLTLDWAGLRESLVPYTTPPGAGVRIRAGAAPIPPTTSGFFNLKTILILGAAGVGVFWLLSKSRKLKTMSRSEAKDDPYVD